MAVNYKKLRYGLVDERISMAKLIKISDIVDYAMRPISKCKDVSMEVLTKIALC